MPSSTSTDAYQELLRLLLALRKSSGVTQAELSKRLGKPQPFISNVERGVRRIDVIEFCAIVQALNGKPEVFFAELSSRLPARLKI